MDRFFRRGLSEIHAIAVGDIADPGEVPTLTEVQNNGIDLTEVVAAINGFQFTNSSIPTPHLGSTFTPNISGEDTADNSSFDLYDDKLSSVVRSALAKGNQLVVVLAPYGLTAALRGELWPVTSAGVNDAWDLGNVAAQTNVPFAIRDVPDQNWEIPAT